MFGRELILLLYRDGMVKDNGLSRHSLQGQPLASLHCLSHLYTRSFLLPALSQCRNLAFFIVLVTTKQ